MEQNYNRKMNMNRETTYDPHYCRLQTEPFQHGQTDIDAYLSRKGGYLKSGKKGSGCTSKISAEDSALSSLVNQISKVLGLRYKENGEWVILKEWELKNPHKFTTLIDDIRDHIAWTEYHNENHRHGVVHFTAIENALKAVMS